MAAQYGGLIQVCYQLEKGKNNMYINFIKRNLFTFRTLHFLITLIVTVVRFEVNLLYLFFVGCFFFGLILYFLMKFVFANSESRQLNWTLLFFDIALILFSILAVLNGNEYSYFVVLISSLRFPYVEFCNRFDIS